MGDTVAIPCRGAQTGVRGVVLCRATGAQEVEDWGEAPPPRRGHSLVLKSVYSALNENTNLTILFPIRFYHLC